MQVDEQLAKKRLEDVMDRLLIHHGWESPRRAVSLIIRNIDLSDCQQPGEYERGYRDAMVRKGKSIFLLELAIARLRQQFKTYAFHTSNCVVHHTRAPCDCGFDQANKQAGGE